VELGIRYSYIYTTEQQNPDFTYLYLAFSAINALFSTPGQIPKRTVFFGFYTILYAPHKNVKLGFYCGNEQTKNILTLLP